MKPLLPRQRHPLRVYDNFMGPGGTKNIIIEVDDSLEVYSNLFRNALRIHASAPVSLLASPFSSNLIMRLHLLMFSQMPGLELVW